MDQLDVGEAFLLGALTGGAGVLLLGALLALGRPWAMAFFAGRPVSLVQTLGMRLRGTPPRIVISTYVALAKAGDDVPLEEIEAIYLATPGAIHTTGDLIARVQSLTKAPVGGLRAGGAA